VPVIETRYRVEGWGTGELWTRGDALVAHWFTFDPVPAEGAPSGRPEVGADLGAGGRRGARSRPPRGVCGPPTSTIATASSRMGDDSVSRSRQRCAGERAADGPAERAARDLVERLRAFLEGGDDGFRDVRLDLEDATPFQRALTTALRAVPRGETVTYGELAALAGRPGAHRAAGTFCAGNRFAFVVPCHRVVAANGIGGYGAAGVAVKRRLLALEGVAA
jgi:methylated-DNA-[protein]-cysteine S-methyltransferase